jgi:hypothetical protein
MYYILYYDYIIIDIQYFLVIKSFISKYQIRLYQNRLN